MRFLFTILSFLLLSLCLNACPSEKRNIEDDNQVTSEGQDPSPSHATYYIENSAGNFGYVTDYNEYISVVSELAQKPRFVTSEVSQEFFFINGVRSIIENRIGTSAQYFTTKLNRNDFNIGDISGNDLNKMFQIVLNRTRSDSISLFVSDFIFDILNKEDPLNALVVQGRETRRQFIARLDQERDIQTLIIKLSSNFNGIYYYGAHQGGTRINMSRPYYVFVFGESGILNRYFDDVYIESLNGYNYHTRIVIPEEIEAQYQVSSYNMIGSFRYSRTDRNHLTNVRVSNRHNDILQFSVAVDFSKMPVPDSYLKDVSNYDLSTNYKLVEIVNAKQSMHLGITDFQPTHVLTLESRYPQGILDVNLLYNIPDWVEESHTDDDMNIEKQQNKTWGFKYLVSGIIEAYQHLSDQDYLVSMRILIE